jgi:hypothetical protein
MLLGLAQPLQRLPPAVGERTLGGEPGAQVARHRQGLRQLDRLLRLLGGLVGAPVAAVQHGPGPGEVRQVQGGTPDRRRDEFVVPVPAGPAVDDPEQQVRALVAGAADRRHPAVGHGRVGEVGEGALVVLLQQRTHAPDVAPDLVAVSEGGAAGLAQPRQRVLHQVALAAAGGDPGGDPGGQQFQFAQPELAGQVGGAPDTDGRLVVVAGVDVHVGEVQVDPGERDDRAGVEGGAAGRQ